MKTTNISLVVKLLDSNGIKSETEFAFAKSIGRKWRFDLAIPDYRIALEIQGGIFIAGRHSRGASLLKEWDKLNCAAAMGWRVIYCQPKDVKSGRAYNLIMDVINGRTNQWRKIK